MTERLTRHGNVLTVVVIVDDPTYLDEPFVQSWCLMLNPDQQLLPRGLDTGSIVEMTPRPKGYVPHYLPGRNPFLHEFADKTGIPLEAAQGGRATMYPEYAAKLRTVAAPATHTASR